PGFEGLLAVAALGALAVLAARKN
ncbi:MAG: PGF-CTERM sorting domain-containing protein, partial [Euryarchaeota archaeon]|nr:PGF-CTERM sorting domain-containing protein [Euryarchaeota archaeon]